MDYSVRWHCAGVTSIPNIQLSKRTKDYFVHIHCGSARVYASCLPHFGTQANGGSIIKLSPIRIILQLLYPSAHVLSAGKSHIGIPKFEGFPRSFRNMVWMNSCNIYHIIRITANFNKVIL